ncbi:unnamed protein product [Diamesa serratosioi]
MKLFLTLVMICIASVNANANEEEIAVPTAGINLKSLPDSLTNAKIHGSTFNADASTTGMKLKSMLANRFDQKTLDFITSYATAKANKIVSKDNKISALKSMLSKELNIEPTEERATRRLNRIHKIMSKLPEKYQLPADFKFPENFEFSHRKSTQNSEA